MDRVHQIEPTPAGRRLLVRLGLLAFCAGLLLLLSSRPANAAERGQLGLLDPVGTTSKAAAKEVGSLAGRAPGSGSSTVAAGAVRHAVAPQPRPATRAVRAAARPTANRVAPATTSRVRRVEPAVTSGVRRVAPAVTSGVHRVGSADQPTTPGGQVLAPRRVGPSGGRIRAPWLLGPPEGESSPPGCGVLAAVHSPGGCGVLAPVGAVLQPLGSALAPVGSALGPVASGLGAVGDLVDTLVPVGLVPLPRGLLGPAGAAPASAGPATDLTDPNLSAGPADLSPAAAGAGPWSHVTRPNSSGPAPAGAAGRPGRPASAELPVGGTDPLPTASGAGLLLAALAAFLLLTGGGGRGRARPDGSRGLSRSYLPLVSPA